MDPKDVLDLVGYNQWATGIILEQAGKVSPELLIAGVTPDPGYGSLRGILVHTLDTEISWRQTVQGFELSPDLIELDFPDIPTLKRQWEIESEKWWSFVKSLSAKELNAAYTYQFDNGPVRTRLVWQTIVHVVNHGTQHRSEAAVLLTSYGYSPGDLTFNYYIHARAAP